MTYREQLCNFLQTISSASELLKYEKNVPIAYVSIEITEQFFDFFHPKEADFVAEFTSEELVEVSIFSGYLDFAADAVIAVEHPTVSEVLKIGSWREMMKKAQALRLLVNREPSIKRANGEQGVAPNP